tara:strand:- start:820 stop:1251 length:432 start_codon:yes stop_codon:yes gene_type:complete
MMNLKINQQLIIPSHEIKWRFSRSSGPGGQNVNKIESQVEIIFNIQKSTVLSSFQKNLLLKKLNNKIINGCISIKVQEKRTQLKNRQLAIQKLISLIKDIIISKEKVRRITRPSKSSQIRRVESKKQRGELKQKRHNNLEQDL